MSDPLLPPTSTTPPPYPPPPPRRPLGSKVLLFGGVVLVVLALLMWMQRGDNGNHDVLQDRMPDGTTEGVHQAPAGKADGTLPVDTLDSASIPPMRPSPQE
jgi:hypothetical protein